jgi:5-formyltetrahydrofolate cyclo-ligase
VSELPSHRLKQAKRTLRREIVARRDALPPDDRTERSRRIVDRLLALPEVASARAGMAYWSFGSEVETAPLIARWDAAQVRLALPRISGEEIEAVAYRRGDPVRETRFGAMEPSGGDAVAPDEIDVVVVPGVAFDRAGHRVGYGGGFYDRFLPRTRPDALAVAIAFALQVVEEVPRGGGDRGVDVVVTEDEVIRC